AAENRDRKRVENFLRVTESRFIQSLLAKFDLEPSNYGSAKLKTSLPAAILMYCLPSTAYVMGEALMFCPVLKCHKGLPSIAFKASKDSASSPKKSRPLAVVMVPPEE